jgi:exopolyphosphatase/guanosine-5'-triphosphate,3'-diphosphate pyrophosphatase
MIVGELRHGQIVILDRLRETVRLAEGLTQNGELSTVARERAVDCLSRFGERLRDMRAGSVRAAGTSTLRRIEEGSGFLSEAEAALGHPIDIVSGLEEARLIYQGVVSSLPPNDGDRLVMDIGGGSTELILGTGLRPGKLESLHLGCVALTERFFGDGKISTTAFANARKAARLELRPVKAFFRSAENVEAIGTSGTIRATERVATEIGLTDDHSLSSGMLEKLIEHVLGFDRISDLSMPGLSERRAQVWPGGLAILVELINVLRIDRLITTNGAMREGLLHDLLGRIQHEDAREQSVRAMMTRYQVDSAQAERVATTSGQLLDQCAAAWRIDSPRFVQLLRWSSCLHEIGLDISHDGYQRHGAYVAENADMPGFPLAEKRCLAYLIENQRRQYNSRLLKSLPRDWRESALRLAMILRLAVLLNRSRSAAVAPIVKIVVDDQAIGLSFDRDWLAANPLTIADLERERDYLQETDYSLIFS